MPLFSRSSASASGDASVSASASVHSTQSQKQKTKPKQSRMKLKRFHLKKSQGQADKQNHANDQIKDDALESSTYPLPQALGGVSTSATVASSSRVPPAVVMTPKLVSSASAFASDAISTTTTATAGASTGGPLIIENNTFDLLARVRQLPVPVTKVVKAAEQQVTAHGHELDGFLSFDNGFLPMLYPEKSLPPPWQPWNDLSQNLPEMVSQLTLRSHVETKLPLLPLDGLHPKYYYRVALILGMAAHAYWYCGPQEPTAELPDTLKIPWDTVNRLLGRNGTYLSGEDVQLYNFNYQPQLLTEETQAPILHEDGNNNITRSSTPRFWNSQQDAYRMENLCMLQPMWGNQAERVFHLSFCEMAKAAAPTLAYFALAQDAVIRDDTDDLIDAIELLKRAIERIATAFMKIIPESSAMNGVDPLVWAKTVAPVGVSFNEGMPSPSGLGTPFFHCLDVFFSRGKYSSMLGRDSIQARDFFPPNWHKILAALNDVNVYVYVASSDDQRLHEAWSQCLNTYAGWEGMLGKHLQKTYGFLEMAFKTGSEKALGKPRHTSLCSDGMRLFQHRTNRLTRQFSFTIKGGFGGGFRDRMWDKIMDMLDNSREERLRAHSATFRLPVAKPLQMIGKGNTVSLTLSLPHDCFSWKPGDTVALYPSNSDLMVNNLLDAMHATGEEILRVPPSDWRLHIKSMMDLGLYNGMQGGTLTLRQLLKLAEITHVPISTSQYLARFFPGSNVLNQVMLAHKECTLAEILGPLALASSGGSKFFGLQADGTLSGMTLMSAKDLFDSLNKSLSKTGPLVEDLMEVVDAVGGKALPLLSGKRVSFDEFEKRIYPCIYQVGNREEAGNIFELLVPLSQRQYSIANVYDKSDPKLCLMVSRLSYKRKIDDSRWTPKSRASKRAHGLSVKYVKKWRAFVQKQKELREKEEQNCFQSWFAPRSAKNNAIETVADKPAVTDLLSGFRDGHEIKINGTASNFICDGNDLFFQVCANPSFRPPAIDSPLVMIGAGSGISPFFGYLEERANNGSCGPTIVLWSVPYLIECEHALPELAKMLKRLQTSSIEVHVIVSHEDKWPVYREGSFRMESRPRCGMTEFIRRNQALRKTLQKIILPSTYGGRSGYTYLCGSATFVHEVLDDVDGILMDFALLNPDDDLSVLLQEDAAGKPVKWLVTKLLEDQKVVYEVFNDKPSKNPPCFGISDLVLRNDTSDMTKGLWLVVYGEIYDLRSFVHPGGFTILHSYLGMDASTAWEAVRHHRSQSLNAKLATLHVGKLVQPEFPAHPVMVLPNNDLTNPNSICAKWRDLLFDVVEIENAMQIEYKLVQKHIAGKASPSEVTPMKLQMVFKAHRRFLLTHVASLLHVGLKTAQDHALALARPLDREGSDHRPPTMYSSNTVGTSPYQKLVEELASGSHARDAVLSCDTLVD